MKQADVKERLERAIKVFFEKEKFLIGANDLNERTITHKLANYIEREFEGYDVDCEYNRMVDGDEYVKKVLYGLVEEVKTDDTSGKTVFPDIIVHKRGNNKDNLLVVEVKKSCRTGQEKEGCKKDCRKIELYMEQLHYKNGLFLILDGSQTKWYQKTT